MTLMLNQMLGPSTFKKGVSVSYSDSGHYSVLLENYDLYHRYAVYSIVIMAQNS